MTDVSSEVIVVVNDVVVAVDDAPRNRPYRLSYPFPNVMVNICDLFDAVTIDDDDDKDE
jgi:hypothetical protein